MHWLNMNKRALDNNKECKKATEGKEKAFSMMEEGTQETILNNIREDDSIYDHQDHTAGTFC